MEEINNFPVYQIDEILDYIEFSSENKYNLKKRMLEVFKEDQCYIYDIRNNLLFVKGIVKDNPTQLILLTSSKTHLHKEDNDEFLNRNHYLEKEIFIYNDQIYQNMGENVLIKGYIMPRYLIR